MLWAGQWSERSLSLGQIKLWAWWTIESDLYKMESISLYTSYSFILPSCSGRNIDNIPTLIQAYHDIYFHKIVAIQMHICCVFLSGVEWKEMIQVEKYDLGNEGEEQQSTNNQDFFLNPHKKVDFFLNSELLKCPSKYSSRNCPHWHRSEKGN